MPIFDPALFGPSNPKVFDAQPDPSPYGSEIIVSTSTISIVVTTVPEIDVEVAA